MQEFWIRLESLFIVVSSLWGYNMTIDKREQENKKIDGVYKVISFGLDV